MTTKTINGNTVKLATIEKKAKSIGTRGKTLQQDIHEAALLGLLFAEENNGDATGINVVYQNLPVSIRRASFKAWVEFNAPLRFVTKKSKTGAQAKVFQKDKSKAAEQKSYEHKNAQDIPFWQFEPTKGDKESEPLTVEDVQKQIARYMKTIKTKNEGNDKVISFIEAIEQRAGINQQEAA